MNGTNLPMRGYTYASNTSNLENGGEHDDFGCEYTQYFFVSTPGTNGIDNISDNYSIKVYPNPAKSLNNIDVNGSVNNEASIQLINVLGQVVYTTKTRNHHISILTTGLSNGIYSLEYTLGDSKRIEKVVINK